VNVLQRSAEETLIVRRVLVGDATLFMQARARVPYLCVDSFRETSRSVWKKKFVKKNELARGGWFYTLALVCVFDNFFQKRHKFQGEKKGKRG